MKVTQFSTLLFIIIEICCSQSRERKVRSKCTNRNALVVRSSQTGRFQLLSAGVPSGSSSAKLLKVDYDQASNVPKAARWKLCTYSLQADRNVPIYISVQNKQFTMSGLCRKRCSTKLAYLLNPTSSSPAFRDSGGSISLTQPRSEDGGVDNRLLKIRDSSASFINFEIGSQDRSRWLKVGTGGELMFPQAASGDQIRRFPVSLRGNIRGTMTTVFIRDGNDRFRLAYGQNSSEITFERTNGQGRRPTAPNFEVTLYKIFTLPNPQPGAGFQTQLGLQLSRVDDGRFLTAGEELDETTSPYIPVDFQGDDGDNPLLFGNSEFFSVTRQLFLYEQVSGNTFRLSSAVFEEFALGGRSQRQLRNLVLAQVAELSPRKRNKLARDIEIDNMPDEDFPDVTP